YSKDEALKFLTEDVAGNIENMQLVRNPDEVQRLIQLTGLSESELLSPAYLYGFWFLSVSSSKNRRITEVTSAVGKRIDEEIQEYLNSWELGSTVCMWRDKPWFRIKITRPQIQDGGMRIDFTRCKPSATGLEWIEAGWRDEFFLLDQIADYAYRTADFVTDFSNKTSPGDVYRLRLVVTERTHYMTSPKKNRLMVVNGRGDKIPEWIKEGRAERYESRSLFLDSLASQLEVALIPHLAKHPDWPWMVFNNDSSVVIESENRSPLRFSVAECWILRYEICLKEEVAPGVFDRVPVRVKEMQALKERLEKRLKELDKACIPPTDDQPVPDFEPV
ncbi:MAG: hypothetical protein LBV49_06195, partial [Azonexus sp.]|nr:hypothetical protein [Azonexus sp.]